MPSKPPLDLEEWRKLPLIQDPDLWTRLACYILWRALLDVCVSLTVTHRGAHGVFLDRLPYPYQDFKELFRDEDGEMPHCELSIFFRSVWSEQLADIVGINVNVMRSVYWKARYDSIYRRNLSHKLQAVWTGARIGSMRRRHEKAAHYFWNRGTARQKFDIMAA